MQVSLLCLGCGVDGRRCVCVCVCTSVEFGERRWRVVSGDGGDEMR